ncbi:hypothetical protein KIPE111705_20590 [Kibdelosporangium persicum]|uniref:Crocagin biosynthetic protein CgnE/B domain-containing protein n=1 Tax=Kibdelosporangium persicum TaxID=2698649 RepID=A0ABX2FHW7_9PSEU|nr:hypothetical protein [Kibdelosporangium persicum]NRN70999.1 hypothetical protein [Kibdelosporangium persicum]
MFVASPTVRAAVALDNRDGRRIEELEWNRDDDRARLIARFAELRAEGLSCDVLWIADDEFEHFLPEHISNVRLAAISFFSSPFSAAALRRYMRIIETCDYANERRIEKALIRCLDVAARIHFRTPVMETHAVFDHRGATHWFSLNGALERGEQTVLPTGELSVLTDAAGDFSLSTPFALDGELVLRGTPIVHRGNRAVTEAETASAYQAMSTMLEYPVIARVEAGVVVGLRSPVRRHNPFAEALERLFSIDERYRKVHEIGFGTNVACAQLASGNFFPNERTPGVHFGFGLGGHTPFHIDLACTQIDTQIELTSGAMVDLYQALRLPRGNNDPVDDNR